MFIDQPLVDDLKGVLGKCSNDAFYRRVTDAVKLANNKAKVNDWNVGLMDICVCDGCVTLPADVATVISVNVDGSPMLMRDQWFQFHINGTGTDQYAPWGYVDELGPVCTYRDPSAPVQLVAETENPLDSNVVTLRVFGWDENGKRIYTEGSNGVLEDGFLVPVIYGFSAPNPSAPSIARIDRIKKSESNGFIRLIAIDPDDGTSHTQIGHYMPWETQPSYRRIRVPDRTWLRIKYRRLDVPVRGIGDWINIENREALMLILRSVKLRADGQIDQARIYENEGVRMLSEEAEVLRPNAISPPQIIVDSTMGGGNEQDRMFY
jgi:hypothetical protein